MMHDMDWHGWGGHMFGWWGVIVMGILILAVIAIILRSQANETRSGENTALDVLERRYAEGEIDREEFEEKKRDLQG